MTLKQDEIPLQRSAYLRKLLDRSRSPEKRIVRNRRELMVAYRAEKREALLNELTWKRECPLCGRTFPKSKSWVLRPIPLGEPVRCRSCHTSKRLPLLLANWKRENMLKRTEKMEQMLADSKPKVDSAGIGFDCRDIRREQKQQAKIALLDKVVPNRVCPLCKRTFHNVRTWVIDTIPKGEPIRCKSCHTSKRGPMLLAKWKKENNKNG